MKKKIFSKGLYLDGLRQLRMVGIITTAILTVLAILIPAAGGIYQLIRHDNISYEDQVINHDQEAINRDIISGVGANPFLFAIFLLIAPLMAIMLFSFLTKRRTSDFYHSIPHTRICIFLSFSASIMTWIAIEILVTSAGAALTYLIFSKFFELLFSELLILMVSTFAASVLAVGAVSIAISLTGTTGSNVLLSLMILFIPRILIFAFSSTILSQTPILVKSNVFPLFANDYNLYTAILFQIFDWHFSYNAYLQLHGIIYSLILGLIYLGLGLLFFVRRRSESAERSAPSRALQTVYRTLLTCTFCLIPCIYFFVTVTDGYGGVDGDTVLSMAVLYILSLIIYFSYEILTTRKWKNLLRAIPGLAIVLAVNLAVIGGLFGIRAYHLSFTPDADEITGISVILDDGSRYSYNLSFEDYVNTQMDEIVLNSDEVINTVSTALSVNTSALKESLNDWDSYGVGYEDKGGYLEYSYEEMTFRIHTKFGSKVRRLKIAAEDADRIKKLLIENEQYFDLWTNLPKPAANSLHYSYGYIYKPYLEISKKWVKEFTETMQQEINGMDAETLINIVRNGQFGGDYDRIATVNYPIRVGTSVNVYTIPISYRYMPKTAALILRMNSSDKYAQKRVLDQIKNMLDDWPDGCSVYGGIGFLRPDSDGVLYINHSNDIYIETLQTKYAMLALLLEKAECRPVEYGEPFVELDLDMLFNINEADAVDVSYRGFIPLSSLTDEDLENLGITLTPGPVEIYPRNN